MAKIGDEVWTVVAAVQDGDAPRVEAVLLSREAGLEFIMGALEEHFYQRGRYAAFPKSSAAVAAFVRGESTSFEESMLNWEDLANGRAGLGITRETFIEKWAGDAGEEVFECFYGGIATAKYVLQKMYVEK